MTTTCSNVNFPVPSVSVALWSFSLVVSCFHGDEARVQNARKRYLSIFDPTPNTWNLNSKKKFLIFNLPVRKENFFSNFLILIGAALVIIKEKKIMLTKSCDMKDRTQNRFTVITIIISNYFFILIIYCTLI